MRLISAFFGFIAVLSPLRLAAQDSDGDTLKAWRRLELQGQRYHTLAQTLSMDLVQGLTASGSSSEGSDIVRKANDAGFRLVASSDLLYLLDQITEPINREIAQRMIQLSLERYAREINFDLQLLNLQLQSPGWFKTPLVTQAALHLKDELRTGSSMLKVLATDFRDETPSAERRPSPLSPPTHSEISPRKEGEMPLKTNAIDWVTIRAHHGVVVQLPAHWRIQGEPENARQEARANAIVDLTKLQQNNTALILQASAPNAGITVSVIPGNFADQATVSLLTPARLISVNSDFRSDLEAVMQAEGAELLEYRGTSKEKVGSLWSLVTRYTYRMPGHAPLDMESHRIFLGDRSLGVMLQATVGAPKEMAEIFKAIKQSFRVHTPD